MTAPGGAERRFTVIYRALADYSDLIRKTREARAERKAMHEEETKGASSSAKANKTAEDAEKLRIKSTTTLGEESKKSAKSVQDSYDTARKSIQDISKSVNELGTTSDSTDGRIKRMLDRFKGVSLPSRSKAASSSSSSDTHLSSAATRDTEDVASALRDVSDESSDTQNKLSSLFSLIGRGFNNSKKSAEDFGDTSQEAGKKFRLVFGESVLEKLGLVKKKTDEVGDSLKDLSDRGFIDLSSMLRDASNDTKPAHGGFNVGRHRVIDTPFKDISDGGGGGGGGRGGGGLRSFGDDANKSSDAAKKVIKVFDDLLSKLGPVAARFISIASAIAPLIAALGSLGGLLVGAATEFGNLSGVVAAVPGLFAAAGTGIAALIVGISPLLNIFKAFQQQQKAAAQAAATNGKAQKDAALAVREGQLGVADASLSEKEANLQVLRSTENLNQARREAARTLEDLRDAAKSDALAEQDSQLSYEEAVYNLKKVLADPNATLLERQRALLGVKEADAARSDQSKKSRRDQEDLNNAEKKGVEGSNQVVDAKMAQQRALIAAQQASVNMQKASITLAQALKEQKHGGTAASAAIDQLNQMLKNASPSTRAFAEGLLGVQKPILAIQKNTSEALFKPLVGQLGNIKSLLPTVSTLLTDAAGAIGSVAAKGIAMISSGPWKADFATISKNNVSLIKTLGDAALHVADAFRNIAVAAGPFTQWVAGAIDRMAKGFDDFSKKARDGGGLAAFLTNTEKTLSQAWVIIKNFGSGIYSLFKSSQDFTGWLMDRIEKLSARFKDWSKAQEDPTSRFQTWLRDIKPTLTAIGALIGAVATAFGHMASDPKNLETANHLLGILKDDILPPIQRILDSLGQSGFLDKVGGILGTILDDIADFLAGGGSGSLDAFISVLTGFFNILSWFLKIPGVVPILSGIAAALGAFAALRLITKLPILSQLIDGLSWIIKNKTGFSGILSDLPSMLAKAFGFGNGPGAKSPADRANKSAASGSDTKRWTTLFTKFDRKIALEVEMNAWLEKILIAIDRLKLNGGLSENSPNVDINEPGSKSKNKSHVTAGEAEKVEEDIVKATSKWGRFGKILGGTADFALSIFTGFSISDLSGMKNLIPGLKSKPKPAAAATEAAEKTTAKAGEEAASKPGFLSRLWNAVSGNAGKSAAGEGEAARVASTAGKVGRVGRFAEAADPLSWAGLGVGIAADTIWTGKDRKKPAAQVARATGAVLSGAGIGALAGTAILPVVGTAIGAGIGAVAGGAYSLYKDPGLRKTVGSALNASTGGGFSAAASVLSDAGKGFKDHVGGPIADFFTKQLPGFLGKIPDFFTKTIPGAIGNFFTQTLPGLFDKIGTFFTSLPGKVLEFIGKVAFDIQYFVTKTIPDFFTKTIPHWFDNVRDSLVDRWHDVENFFTHDVPNFFTKTIPRWWHNILGSIRNVWHGVENFFTKDVPNFFTKTIPHWWNNLTGAVRGAWHGVENFFTKDVPSFFTKTIPHWWSNLGKIFRSAWHGVENFFTQDVPNFFTKVLPKWFHNIVGAVRTSWEGVVTFFTEDIPNFFMNVIPGWFKGIGQAISDDVVKPVADFFGGAWNFIKKHLGKGYNDEKKAKEDAQNDLGHAEGGEVTGTFTGKQDTVVRRLTPGEFVIRRTISQQPEVKSFLSGLNSGKISIAPATRTLDASTMTARLPNMDGLNSAVRSASSVGGTLPSGVGTATSSVTSSTNHSYDNSRSTVMNFGDIVSNNPSQERTSTSLRRQVESLAYRTDDDR